jgi:ankyrin repeat protein
MPSAFFIPAMTLFTLALLLTLWPLLILWRQVRNGQIVSLKPVWFLLAGLLLWNLFCWAFLIKNSLLAHDAIEQQLLPWKVLAATVLLGVFPATVFFSFRLGWNRGIRAGAKIPFFKLFPRAGVLLMGVELLLLLSIVAKIVGSPLPYAARQGSMPLVRAALLLGADPNASDFYGCTPLRYATWNRNAAMARLLLQRGANPNARAETGWTPLMEACVAGNVELIGVLLEAGADPALETSSASPLEILARESTPEPACLEAASLLIRRGVHPSSFDSALIAAAAAGKTGMISLLLQHEAGVDAQDRSGQTPLQLAVLAQHAGIVRQLLDAGANPDLADRRGCTALHKATAAIPGREDIEAFRLLFEKKPAIDAADADEWTALTHAVAVRRNDLVELFLRAGAGVNRVDKNGMTPLMWAASAGAAETAELLLRNGADPLMRDSQDLSAREYALRSGFRELAEFLGEASSSPKLLPPPPPLQEDRSSSPSQKKGAEFYP